MRFKALLATLFVAGLAVSVAVAHPPPGKGKGKHESSTAAVEQPSCHPKVSFILKGDYVSGTFSENGEGSFAMLVKQANKHGRQYAGMQVTVEVGAYTKVKRRGKATVADLMAGDKLVVHVRGCKAAKGEAATDEAPVLFAKHVNAKGPKAEDDDSTTTTSTTDTTTTTTTTTSP
jgi:hypothetical protein